MKSFRDESEKKYFFNFFLFVNGREGKMSKMFARQLFFSLYLHLHHQNNTMPTSSLVIFPSITNVELSKVLLNLA